MKQSEFLKVLHKDLKSSGYAKSMSETTEISNILFDCLKDCLIKGNNISIMNLGEFKLHLKKMRNPADPNSETFLRWVVTFSSSYKLSSKLNEEIKRKEPTNSFRKL